MITDSPTATVPVRDDATAGSRIGATLRLHTVAWPLLIAWPVGILAGSFLISYVIFALLQSDQDTTSLAACSPSTASSWPSTCRR